MKTKSLMLLLTTSVGLALAAGCDKKETPLETATPVPPPAQSQTATNAQPETTEAQPDSAAAQNAERIQSMLDTAKNLTEQGNYAEALVVIGELSKLTLTPEQQTAVDEQKKSAEQGVAAAAADKTASGAADALGGTLGGDQ